MINKSTDKLCANTFVDTNLYSSLISIDFDHEQEIYNLFDKHYFLPLLLSGIELAEDRLRRFALDPLFFAKLQLAFGKGFDLARLTALQQAWSVGDFSLFPAIKILSEMDIGSANAAFVASTNTIYISNAFLERSSKNPDAIAYNLIAFAQDPQWHQPLLAYALAYSHQVKSDYRSFCNALAEVNS
jgi:hypothetical protein